LLTPLQSLVDRLHLRAVAIGEDHADVAVALLAGQIVGIHAFVLLALAARLGFVLDVRADLASHRQERFAGSSSEKPFA